MLRTLPADYNRCMGNDCPNRDYCLRHTTPAIDHPRQCWMLSPYTYESGEIPCTEFLSDLDVGERAKFFHPGTMGVMLWATVVELIDNENVIVKFDEAYPGSRKKTFNVSRVHNKGK